jgi:hypothetical protein
MKKADRSKHLEVVMRIQAATRRIAGLDHIREGKFLLTRQTQNRWTIGVLTPKPIRVKGWTIVVATYTAFDAREAARIFLQRNGVHAKAVERAQPVPYHGAAHGVFGRVVLLSKKEREIVEERFDLRALMKEAECLVKMPKR